MNTGAAAIKHLFISSGHNFFGHHGRTPDDFLAVDCPQIECKEGAGIVGDRYFNYKPDYIGQITFFAWETYLDICEKFGLSNLPSSVFRRNVITVQTDLNALIGHEFEMQGVHFFGTEEARPCDWMNLAVADGVKVALKGRGGLRARILGDGFLRPGPSGLLVAETVC